ncbi:Rieske 2Fe-2S domain-containing protein [Streptomyces hesseae]|uniref:Rieske 2Fe-2S domain-containing protein n=1 Tax=Streptomyces hesseae TaxID=3075519 RepID=A0ABU2SPW1_9ACTN|nr:Rieske 2Fe-2S domain-containing protein [Streptomyces sp. DSM 40473]MDT0450798.1 Rieske 2Fe-2S domain-containing protein [Streptomyces sp. DSM 40473]
MTGLDRFSNPPAEGLPAEGADGLYSQSWFPLCLSEDVPAGAVLGVEFLGGKAVVFRGREGGPARVLSGYCVHVGADLSVGEVVGERLRCRFHGWQYDGGGMCAATGIGDPVPPRARLFRFPAVERHGVVWAFNGEEPLFGVPGLPYREDELTVRRSVLPELPVEPWLVQAHTMDLQHLCLPHEFVLDDDPNDSVRIGAHSVGFDLRARMRDGERFDVRVDIHGTNIFWQTGTLEGRWFFWLAPLNIPGPGRSRAVFVYGARPEDGEDPKETEAFLDRARTAMMNLFDDDTPVLGTIRFRPGHLTHGDRTLARYLDYVRAYPRANPARDHLT